MAITKEQALAIARKRLAGMGGEHELVVLEDKIVERDFGWVFLCTSQAFLETGDPDNAIPGIGPLVVLKDDGATEFLSTSSSPDVVIDNFERQRRDAGN